MLTFKFSSPNLQIFMPFYAQSHDLLKYWSTKYTRILLKNIGIPVQKKKNWLKLRNAFTQRTILKSQEAKEAHGNSEG